MSEPNRPAKGEVTIEVVVTYSRKLMSEDAEEWDRLTESERFDYAYDFACEQGMIEVTCQEVARG